MEQHTITEVNPDDLADPFVSDKGYAYYGVKTDKTSDRWHNVTVRKDKAPPHAGEVLDVETIWPAKGRGNPMLKIARGGQTQNTNQYVASAPNTTGGTQDKPPEDTRQNAILRQVAGKCAAAVLQGTAPSPDSILSLIDWFYNDFKRYAEGFESNGGEFSNGVVGSAGAKYLNAVLDEHSIDAAKACMLLTSIGAELKDSLDDSFASLTQEQADQYEAKVKDAIPF